MSFDLSALQQAFAEPDDQTPSETGVTGQEAQPESRADEGASQEHQQAGQEEPHTEAEPSTSASNETPRVPYSRFKSVVDEKNSLKAEIEKLRSQLESKPSSASYEEEDLSFLDTDGPDPVVKDLQERISRFEQAQAQAQLKAEVSAVVAEHPGVPASVLYKAVAEDPSIDLTVVAVQYTEYVESIKQKAIEEYQSKQKVAPPPHVPRAGNGQFTGSKAPKTMADAHAALAKALSGGL